MRREVLRRRYHATASLGELAHQPVGLQRIVEPRLGPTALKAAAHDGGVDILTVEIEKRQLAACLSKSATQVKKFMQSWKITFQLIIIQRKSVERTRLTAHDIAISKHGGVPL